MLKRRWFILFILILSLNATNLLILAQDQLVHVVQRGETLYSISKRYGVDLNLLAENNAIANTWRIYAGQTLTIPGQSLPDTVAAETSNPLIAASPETYIVKHGDSLKRIATLYGISVEELIQANNIADANRIYPGQELMIWTPATVDSQITVMDTNLVQEASIPATGDTYTLHIVQPGEYLSQIARNYGISWTDIAAINTIPDPNNINPGTQLQIPSGAVAYTQAADLGIINVAPNANAWGFIEPGPQIGVGREIVVDLSDQMTYAYENGILVYSARASTGLPATPTVQGRFSVYTKLPSQTMSGPGYYLPGVESVMYFYQGYALHGTYWHNNFGYPMSHGCVNLTNGDASWFYSFASVGTPVTVLY
ncbi:hypothetical protein MASR2M15_20170 [Anaerolineales bacterium]